MVHADPPTAGDLIEKKEQLAGYVTDLHFKRHPDVYALYGDIGKKKCYEDVLYHFDFLIEALRADNQELFNRYLGWAHVMLRERNIPKSDLVDNVELMKEAVQQLGSPKVAEVAGSYIDAGIRHLSDQPAPSESFLRSDNPLYEEARQYLSLLLAGHRRQAAELIDRLMEEGTPVKHVYEHIFQVTQYEVGLLWQTNRITVAHEHYCTAATQFIMSRLYEYVFSAEKHGGKMVACSVAGELHEIGIRMVADYFEMDGWDTYYLGANMPDHQLAGALDEYKADILAVSVTMPTHITRAKELIRTVRERDEQKRIKILTGGYPFHIVPDLWKQIGADGTAGSAREAIKMVTQWKENG